MKRIALVTCRVLPEPDFDEEPLLKALADAGMKADMLAWDGSGDPGRYDVCILRSCWNYYERPDDFLAWVANAARVSRLYNNAGVVDWNLHKSYLRDLEAADVPVIPTAWVDRGSSTGLRDLMEERGWNHVVIKPAVSASSFRTCHFKIEEVREGQEFLDALASERDTMVQRYMASVHTTGERALVYIDGQITHAVRKLPRFADGVEQVSDALPVSDAGRAIAERALACATGEVLYGRVDVVEDDDGALAVSELELVEPSLFLLQHPAALERFVSAIARC